MSDNFYRAFEERHRGSRELIKSRLQVYLPFVEQLKQLHSPCTAVDLGCGRGEWLELLTEQGVVVQGVDLDDDMLSACRERGLSVVTGDAIEYLAGLKDASQDIVSGFHLAEHLPFNVLQTLVREALRVLKPAGLLILETPNPENIMVGTTNFYLDPTHERPIPPQLLDFLPEHYGFYRSKILRLQESPDLDAGREPTLLDVLEGVSPDYALVAQKNAETEVLEGFDEVFGKDYGISIGELASRYELKNQKNLDSTIQLVGDVVRQTEERINDAARQTEGKINDVVRQTEGKINDVVRQTEGKINDVVRQTDERTQLLEQRIVTAESRAQQSDAMLADLLDSRSWRITYPLRMFGQFIRKIMKCILTPVDCLKKTLKFIVKPMIVKVISFANNHPALKQRLVAWVTKYPKIDTKLRRFSAARGLSHTQTVTPVNNIPQDQSHLTPSARRIYADLKAAIKDHQKGND